MAVDALRAGASNFVKKPLSLEEILFIVRAHERMLQAEKRQKLPPGCFVSEKKILHLTTNPAIVYSAVHAATHTLEDFLSRQEIESMSLALSEALINAVEHGNLAIGYEDKSEALRENRYQALLDERIQNSRLGSRVVKLEIDLTPKRAIFSIEDEGDGFDWSNRPDPTDPENLLREHGRGLSIINLFMDEVWFNEKGNRIGMLKRLAEQNEDAVE
ncbi:MAG: Serine-protein kinase RsbW [candidate division BRC1 bacterium ADurb.BinA364]|nr:MAG: Serine-protein kinase RsbW [candidate division BRC1 bacterium ADurb.BinA364]